MASQHIHEGTPRELAPYLAQHPDRRFRLIDLALEDEEAAAGTDKARPVIDAENAAAIALLEFWLQEDATDDPEEIRKSEEEYNELKSNLNANRAATGERLIFP